jgi:hypothetical protein
LLAPRFEPTPAPYLERAGELAALDAAFPAAEGVFLVGEEGTGRRALAWTWLARLRAGEGPPHLRALWGEPYIRWGEGTFGVIPFVPPPAGRTAVRAFYDEEGRREHDAARAREEPGSRWLVIVPPDQLDAARRAYDPRGRFATVSLPAVEEPDRIAIWVCASAEVPGADLARVLEVFRLAGRGLELPDAPWVPWVRAGQARGWFSTPDGPRSFTPRPWLRRAVAEGRVELAPRHRANLARYVPGGDLRDLVELDRLARS